MEESGHIYVLYNKMYEKDVYKIGRAKDVNKRLKNYVTSYIEPVELKYMSSEVKDSAKTEMIVKDLLLVHRVKSRREFFKAPIEYIISKVKLAEHITKEGMDYEYSPLDITNNGEDVEENLEKLMTERIFKRKTTREIETEKKREKMERKQEVRRIEEKYKKEKEKDKIPEEREKIETMVKEWLWETYEESKEHWVGANTLYTEFKEIEKYTKLNKATKKLITYRNFRNMLGVELQDKWQKSRTTIRSVANLKRKVT